MEVGITPARDAARLVDMRTDSDNCLLTRGRARMPLPEWNRSADAARKQRGEVLAGSNRRSALAGLGCGGFSASCYRRRSR